MNDNSFLNYLVQKGQLSKEQMKEFSKKLSASSESLEELLIKEGYLSSETLPQFHQEYQHFRVTQIMTPIFQQKEDSTFVHKPLVAMTPEQKILQEVDSSLAQEMLASEQTILKDPSSLRNYSDSSTIQTLPRFLGKYELLEKIGQGGMGSVYKVRHTELSQIYALKVITIEQNSPELVTRFHREAQTTARLKHPHIVQVIDSGQEGNLHYFLMEYVEGKTFEDLIVEEVDIREGLRILKKSLDALHYAHEQGIVHRDIKPGNIFITKEGEPKIGDFGLARDVILDQQQAHKLTKAGEIMGTPAYMSPEQILQGGSELQASADVYSMGVCLYQLLTKRCPFEGKNLQDLFYKILHDEPSPPSKLNPKIHRDLDTITLRSIDKLKNLRYPSAKMFSEDISCFLKGYPIWAKSISPMTHVQKWARRNKGFVTSVAFLVLICAIFLQMQHMKKLKEIQMKAQQHRANSSTIWGKVLQLEANSQNRPQKIKHLLDILNELNLALLFVPRDFEIEQEKLKYARYLIQAACEHQEFALADYVAKEMMNLHSVPSSVIDELNQKVKTEKNKKLQEHLKQLEFWKKKLQQGTVKPELLDNAIFEISKMPEKEIVQELVAVLKEGTLYFLNNPRRSARQDNYYKSMVKALGRLGHENTKFELMNSLTQLSNKLAPLPEKPVADIDFMILILEALNQVRAKNVSKTVAEIRRQMGEYGLFWTRSRVLYKGLVLLNDFKEIEPTTASDYLEQGVAKFDKNDLQGALQDYEQAFQRNPSPEVLKEIYLNRGRVFLTLRQFEQAIEDFSAIIKRAPEHSYSYRQRGLTHYERGAFDEALLDLNQSVLLSPESSQARFLRGLIHLKKDQQKEAYEDFTQAISLNPEHADAYHQRGLIYQQQGRLFEALSDLNQSVYFNPDQVSVLLDRGQIRQEIQDFSGALSDFSEAIRLNPNSDFAYSFRALYFYQQNQYSEALADCHTALNINATNVLVRYYRGLTLYALNEFEPAKKDFLEVLQQASEETEAHYYLGKIFIHFGASSEAKEHFRQFLNSAKNNPSQNISSYQQEIYQLFPELQE